MRSLFMLLSAIVIGSCSLQAQPKNTFGFKGGLNVSTLGGKATGSSARLGYNLGLYAENRLYQELGIQTELIVSLQGARSSSINNLKLNYTYMALPILSNIYFSKGVALEAGLQPAYLLRAVQYDGGDKFSIRDNVNNFDLSGIVGISYNKPFGKAGIRFVLGITNTNGTVFTFDSNSKNKVMQLYIAKTLVTKK
jgi:hypothetical protein